MGVGRLAYGSGDSMLFVPMSKRTGDRRIAAPTRSLNSQTGQRFVFRFLYSVPFVARKIRFAR